MTTQPEQASATTRGAAYTSAIYGVISIAAVIVTWEADGNEWHLVEVIAGYSITLWMMHSYAALVASGHVRPWLHIVREEFPVAAAGIPALGVALLGQLLAWDIEETSDLALVACAATLVAIQTHVVRRNGANRRRVITTVGFDMTLAAVILVLHIVI